MKKLTFYVWNSSYISTHSGRGRKKAFFTTATPWWISCPNGDVIKEATHADAMKRVSILLAKAAG